MVLVAVEVVVAVAVVEVHRSDSLYSGFQQAISHVPHIAGHVFFALSPMTLSFLQLLSSMLLPHSGGSPFPLQALVVVVVVTVVVEWHMPHVVGQVP